MAWTGIVAQAFTPGDFARYVDGLSWEAWEPKFIVLHNTAAPTLAQRPNGFTLQSIKNLESYYRDDRKWSAGPHLFIDDKQIWVFTPLTKPGTHSPSWNRVAIGIEMLGDYDVESFSEGRGFKVREHATWAIAKLSSKLGFAADGWKFHNEDPKTTHDCPGINARRERARLVLEVARDMKPLIAPPRPIDVVWGAMPDDPIQKE